MKANIYELFVSVAAPWGFWKLVKTLTIYPIVTPRGHTWWGVATPTQRNEGDY